GLFKPSAVARKDVVPSGGVRGSQKEGEGRVARVGGGEDRPGGSGLRRPADVAMVQVDLLVGASLGPAGGRVETHSEDLAGTIGYVARTDQRDSRQPLLPRPLEGPVGRGLAGVVQCGSAW